MAQDQSNNPLHGVTIKDMLEFLLARYGFEELEARTGINCFGNRPTFKSSLKFLRKTPWAKAKVERLYLRSIPKRRKGKQGDEKKE